MVLSGLFSNYLTKTCAEPEPSAVISQPEPQPEPAAPEIALYGEQFGKLTRFGNSWIDLNEVVAIEFYPRDGCGAELFLRDQDDALHLSGAEANALRRYMADPANGF